MSVELVSAENIYKELKAEWHRSPKNLKKCGDLLENSKLALTKIAFLPRSGAEADLSHMLVARNILEIAVEHSVMSKDILAFERYMSQLKCYYFDYKQLKPSEHMYKLLGLYLLFLLSENRIADFHIELELLPADAVLNDNFIRPILGLEQYIMEGRYSKIFQMKNSIPAAIYTYFMDTLMVTVRDEIGACIEKAYEKIAIKDAAKRLNLSSMDDMKAYAKKRNWIMDKNNVFNFNEKAVKPKEELPSEELAAHAISYACELEAIV